MPVQTNTAKPSLGLSTPGSGWVGAVGEGLGVGEVGGGGGLGVGVAPGGERGLWPLICRELGLTDEQEEQVRAKRKILGKYF